MSTQIYSGNSVAKVAEAYLTREIEKEVERQRMERHSKLPEGLHWPRIEEIEEVIKRLELAKLENYFKSWCLESFNDPDYVQFVAVAVLYSYKNESNYLKTKDIINTWYIFPAVLCQLVEHAKKINSKIISATNKKSDNAKKAADARHDKPGGSRDLKKQMQSIWLSGKYSSKDICAEEECKAVGLSFSAARKALRNLAKPQKPT